MELGYVTTIENVESLQKAGIKNIELSVPFVMQWTEEQLNANIKKLKDFGVKAESCCVLVLVDFSLYDDKDLSKSREYLSRVLPRLSRLGIKKAVFGSGGFRKMPEGITYAEAKPQIVAFLKLLSELCLPYGIDIAIEPLFKKASNTLNTARETAEIIRELNLPNIRLLIDFAHFFNENELLTEIADYKDILIHVHITNPVNRRNPIDGDGMDYRSWIKTLHDIGYDGMLVSECAEEPNFIDGVISFKNVIEKAIADVINKKS